MTDQAADLWRSAPYVSIADYTHSSAPAWLQEPFQSLFRDAMIARIAARLGDLLPIERAVDLACGVGDWTVRYLPFARSVVGVDVNPRFIAAAEALARPLSRAGRVSFQLMDLRAFDDYEGAGLVAFGGCLLYLDDHDTKHVLTRAREAVVKTGGAVYVRSSCASPLRGPYLSEGGHYRERAGYERLFAEAGLGVLDQAYSVSVAAEGAMGPLPRAVRGSVGAVIGGAVHAARIGRGENDFVNWLLIPG